MAALTPTTMLQLRAAGLHVVSAPPRPARRPQVITAASGNSEGWASRKAHQAEHKVHQAVDAVPGPPRTCDSTRLCVYI